ncbi:hypothetical protein ACIBI9_66520 [Nonomuraea sp. NPDC050451]|uniref:YxiG-like protein n=1 Tax=Nonomuraea sp. NPDC050451 TaxID=3364364 RepID=UPI0037916E89
MVMSPEQAETAQLAMPADRTDPPTTPGYLFRHCVQAHCATTVPADTWRGSLDDRLITYETGAGLDGYLWGVNWQMLYPGATLITDSPTARHWATTIGIDFHEVRIQTNAHDLTLVFSDLGIEELPSGSRGPHHKFPIQ